MIHRSLQLAVAALALLAVAAVCPAADYGLERGPVELKSAGQLAFSPDGILFFGDAKTATVYAIDPGEMKADPAKISYAIDDLGVAMAKAMGVSETNLTVMDLAVNPHSGSLYVSVLYTKLGEPPAHLLRITPANKVERVDLNDVDHSKVTLSAVPDDKVTGEGRRRSNKRLESITDLAFVEGKLIVSGLSDRDAPSTVREIEFPFRKGGSFTSLEIYHGAHGKFENYAPVRTFLPLKIGGEVNVIAGFTCTPLVRIPLGDLEAGETVRGTTVAELGNRNRPLDLISYEKGGKQFLLMANSARGVMKIPVEGLDEQAAITERVARGGTAGQPYETVDALQDVQQLDRLSDTHAVVVTRAKSGKYSLATVELP